jgi:hypothetical protein
MMQLNILEEGCNQMFETFILTAVKYITTIATNSLICTTERHQSDNHSSHTHTLQCVQ